MLLMALIGKAVSDAAGLDSKVEKFIQRLILLDASSRFSIIEEPVDPGEITAQGFTLSFRARPDSLKTLDCHFSLRLRIRL